MASSQRRVPAPLCCRLPAESLRPVAVVRAQIVPLKGNEAAIGNQIPLVALLLTCAARVVGRHGHAASRRPAQHHAQDHCGAQALQHVAATAVRRHCVSQTRSDCAVPARLLSAQGTVGILARMPVYLTNGTRAGAPPGPHDPFFGIVSSLLLIDELGTDDASHESPPVVLCGVCLSLAFSHWRHRRLFFPPRFVAVPQWPDTIATCVSIRLAVELGGLPRLKEEGLDWQLDVISPPVPVSCFHCVCFDGS